MEKQVRFVLVLSLKEMALRKVASVLLTDSEIVASILKLQISGYKFPKIVCEILGDKIKGKMLKLELPELLERQVMDIVKPMCLQIWRWKECQENYLRRANEEINLPDSSKLFWTSTGVVDYRRTAQGLVRCDALDAVQRYQLACFNCLEDDIPLLWRKLPEEAKFCFYDKVTVLRSCRNSILPSLPCCWPHIVAGKLSSLDCFLTGPDGHLSSFNQWAFEHSVENGYKVAVEYFLQKLTREEREASLARTAEALLGTRFEIRSKYPSRFRYQYLSDISCYLLASMTPAQQMEIFRKHPSEVFLRFLDCPWPDLFLENVSLMWDFLPPSGYRDLLFDMAFRFEDSGYYFPKLFQEFFVQSPLDCKKCFIDENSEYVAPASEFLLTFFKSEDSESVEVIFRNIDASDRMRLVLSKYVLRMFFVYMQEKWRVMEVCVREATKSEADRKRLKRAFIEYCRKREVESVSQKFKRFFDFLESDVSGDEGEKAKKLKLENCCP